MNLHRPAKELEKRAAEIPMSTSPTPQSAANSANRECLFCDSRVLSEEHFYPQWMHDLIREDGEFNGHQSVKADFAIEGAVPAAGEPVHRHHSGPPWSRKFKVVCSACNGGWMGDVETDVKDILSRMLLGACRQVGVNWHRPLARWALLKMFIDEHGHPEKLGIHPQIRCTLRAPGLPPPGWRVYLGKYVGTPRRLDCIAAPGAIVKQGIEFQEFITSILFGRVFLHVRGLQGAPADTYETPLSGPKSKLVQLWPSNGEPIAWNRMQALSHDEVVRIANPPRYSDGLRVLTPEISLLGNRPPARRIRPAGKEPPAGKPKK